MTSGQVKIIPSLGESHLHIACFDLVDTLLLLLREMADVRAVHDHAGELTENVDHKLDDNCVGDQEVSEEVLGDFDELGGELSVSMGDY